MRRPPVLNIHKMLAQGSGTHTNGRGCRGIQLPGNGIPLPGSGIPLPGKEIPRDGRMGCFSPDTHSYTNL